MVLKDGQILPDISSLRRFTNEPLEPINRPARVVPIGILTISSVMDEYLEDMGVKQKVSDTQSKLQRWANQFLNVMGDMEIAEIRPKHGYDDIDVIRKKSQHDLIKR